MVQPREPARAQDEELRERLTEREDKRRPLVPWSTLVAGRPLTVGGELDAGLAYLRQKTSGDALDPSRQLFVALGVEGEAFYTFGPALSLFAQLRVGIDEEMLSPSPGRSQGVQVELGELWLDSQNVAGSNVSLDLGRLHFEDDRRWWWDDELDAIRATYEAGNFGLALAAARELTPTRLDLGYIFPEQRGVRRLIGELSWDWRPNHTLGLFALRQDDSSAAGTVDQIVPTELEDESDAQLTWIGTRLMGAFGLRTQGVLGYWLDTGLVRGRECVVEYTEIAPGQSMVDGSSERSVRGWAFDAGIDWFLPATHEPRVFAGYAFGSNAFRQTNLQANETGFGGVQRFPSYGVTLDPELSNLGILTLGAGLSLGRSSSFDLVYHRYRLADPAPSLRNARLPTTLTGQDRDVGQGIDAVLAIEEWAWLELELIASGFRAGRAFGPRAGQWSYWASFVVRINF